MHERKSRENKTLIRKQKQPASSSDQGEGDNAHLPVLASGKAKTD
jgi:hypothetical protein